MTKPPKYQIGDRILNTNIFVRGVMTNSKGEHIYFWQISADNSMVVNEEEIEAMLNVLFFPSDYPD